MNDVLIGRITKPRLQPWTGTLSGLTRWMCYHAVVTRKNIPWVGHGNTIMEAYRDWKHLNPEINTIGYEK